MINKIGIQPSFCSNIRVIYDRDFSLKDFYESDDFKKQLDIVKNNGVDDTVTITPIRGRYGQKPSMTVQVMNDAFYSKDTFDEPQDFLKTYMEMYQKGINDYKVNNNIKIMDYIV